MIDECCRNGVADGGERQQKVTSSCNTEVINGFIMIDECCRNGVADGGERQHESYEVL